LRTFLHLTAGAGMVKWLWHAHYSMGAAMLLFWMDPRFHSGRLPDNVKVWGGHAATWLEKLQHPYFGRA